MSHSCWFFHLGNLSGTTFWTRIIDSFGLKKDSLVIDGYGLRCKLFMFNHEIFIIVWAAAPISFRWTKTVKVFFGKITIIKRALKILAYNKLFHPTGTIENTKALHLNLILNRIRSPFNKQSYSLTTALNNQISVDEKSFFRFTLMTFLLFQSS